MIIEVISMLLFDQSILSKATLSHQNNETSEKVLIHQKDNFSLTIFSHLENISLSAHTIAHNKAANINCNIILTKSIEK